MTNVSKRSNTLIFKHTYSLEIECVRKVIDNSEQIKLIHDYSHVSYTMELYLGIELDKVITIKKTTSDAVFIAFYI